MSVERPPVHRRVGTGGPVGIPAGGGGLVGVIVPVPPDAVVCTVYGVGVQLALTWLQGPTTAPQASAASWTILPGAVAPGVNHTGRVSIPCDAGALELRPLGVVGPAGEWAWVGWET